MTIKSKLVFFLKFKSSSESVVSVVYSAVEAAAVAQGFLEVLGFQSRDYFAGISLLHHAHSRH
jgi:hypothetical protein